MALKKLLFRLGAILIGVGMLIPSLLTTWELKSPLDNQFNYWYPSFATPDDDGNIYTIDNSLSRISKISSSGEVKYLILGGSKSGESFFYASELAVDDLGRLFVLNTVLGPQGFSTIREEILLYSQEGEFLKKVYSKTYRPEEITNHNVTRGRLVSLSVSGRAVSWYELTDSGVVESRVDTVTWKLQQGLAIDIPQSARYISSVTRLDSQNVAYVRRSGEVILQTEGALPKVLYSGDDHLENTTPSVPWWIGRLSSKEIVFTDLTNSRFVKLSLQGDAQGLVGFEDIQKYTGDDFPYIYYVFGQSQTGKIATVNDLGVLVFSPQGKVEASIQGGKYTFITSLYRWLFWVGLLIAFMGVILSFHWIFLYLLHRRVALAVKQLLVLLPILIVFMTLLTMALVTFLNRQVQGRTEDQLSQLAQVLAQGLDQSALSEVVLQKDNSSSAYNSIRDYFHRTLNYNRDPWNKHIYFAFYRIYHEKIYTFMYLNDGVGTFHPFTFLNDSQGIYWKSVQAGIQTLQADDPWGKWLLAVAPVLNSEGKAVGIVEVGRDMYGFNQDILSDLEKVLPLAIGGFLAVILIFIVFTWFFLLPLRELKRGVNRISEGQWETELRIRGHDEVADLTMVFNKMTVYIRNYINEIVALSKGYRRFVPQQFLTHLNRKDVTEVNLGDQIQQEMTVLFTDIRSFTQISERMSPKENFDFLNRYLGLVGPEVRRNNGFIDKYIGDAIMALYPSRAEDAVDTAVGIIHTLAEFNRDQKSINQPEIHIGIGIHTGTLMLGILGEPERFDGSVISDNVNLASRIESLTKTFDAAILISDVTMERVSNKDKYTYRYLGKVKVKGKQEPIGLYEILDGLSKELKVAKTSCSLILEKGILAYQEAKFTEAQGFFQKALELNPGDAPTKMYITLCKQMEGKEIPATWSGAVVMNSK